HLTLEFFPGTFFIPEKEGLNTVSIPNASVYNPTKCLVLELKPSFVQTVYEELVHSQTDHHLLFNRRSEINTPYFLSNDQQLIQAFVRLYDTTRKDSSPGKEMIEELIIREMLYRLFSTEALLLLKENFQASVKDERIGKVMRHIDRDLGRKLTTHSLAEVAGLGQTTFFKVFKEATGLSPIEYVMQERIKRTKVLIQKDKLSLQEIAFHCGFNSYEYFCSTFKKIEGHKPTDYRKYVHQRNVA
ncbi:MAG: helix-turn-helix domain-containing protein, partial [Bacteroidota bacterium]